jgi:hypothetical protein
MFAFLAFINEKKMVIYNHWLNKTYFIKIIIVIKYEKKFYL